MSTLLTTIKDTGRDGVDLDVTRIAGKDHTAMLQLTQGIGIAGIDSPGYIQLTKLDAYRTIQELAKWLQSESRATADRLSGKIKQDQSLEKTLVQDAVDCEQFIRDLEILEIPLRLLG